MVGEKLKAASIFPDRVAAGVVIGILVFVVLLLGVLPQWLRGQETSDYAGVAEQTAPGHVSTVTISPTSQGGGGLFNAVNVTFSGHTAYYALKPGSHWNPIYDQPVTVLYRVGRRSGIVRVDDVTPEASASINGKTTSGQNGP